MIQREHSGHKSFLDRGLGIQLYLLRNKRRVLLSVGVAYVMVIAVLVGVLFKIATPDTTQAFASNGELVTTLQNTSSELGLGGVVTLSLKVQNTSSVGVFDTVSVRFITSENQINWNTATLQSSQKSDPILANSFEFGPLGAQVTKTFLITGQPTSITKPYIAVYAVVSEGSNQLSTNRVFVSTVADNSAEYGVDLSTNKTSILQTESLDIKVTAPENSPYIVPGTIYVLQSGIIKNLYECEVSTLALCATSIKDLKPGKYQVWFESADEAIFSRIIEVEVTNDQPALTISPTATLSLPFGTTSVSDKISVTLQNVTNRNQLPLACKVIFTEVSTQKTKEFVTNSNSSRSCDWLVNVSELPGFGQYTITVEGSALTAEVFALQESATLPLTFPNPNFSSSFPVSLVSGNALTTLAPIEPLTANAELLIYNPTEHTLTTLKPAQVEGLVYTAGNLKVDIDPKYFEIDPIFLVALKVTEVGETNPIIRYSQWNSINFASDVYDVSDATLKLESPSTLSVDTTPVFAVNNIKDGAGQIVDGKACNLTVVQSITKIYSNAGLIAGGVCRISLSTDQKLTPGAVTVSFVTSDSTSLPLTRVFSVSSGAVRTLGAVTPVHNPLIRSVATSLIIGPVKDDLGNMVTSTTLKIKTGSTPATLGQSRPVEINQGFGTVYLPVSAVDSDSIAVQVLDKTDSVLLDTQFGISATDTTTISIPDSVDSAQTLKTQLSGLQVTSGDCELSIVSLGESVASTQVNPLGVCTTETVLPAVDIKALVKITQKKQTYAKVITITPTQASNNFVMFPSLNTTEKGKLKADIISSPLKDVAGLPVRSGTLTAKLNGKITTVEVVSGIASISLLKQDLATNDITTNNSKRMLDLDIEAGSGARSRSLTDSIKAYLGVSEFAESVAVPGVLKLDTVMKSGAITLAKFETPHCSAELSTETGLTPLTTLQLENQCIVFVTGTTGKVKLLLNHNFVTTFEQDIEFVDQPIKLLLTKTPTLQARIAVNQYKLTAKIFDGTKAAQFASGADGVLLFDAQSLSSDLSYKTQFEYEHSDGTQYFWIRSLAGHDLLKNNR